MAGYSHATAPEALRLFLAALVDDTRVLLVDRLTAIVLHGSLAMGSFYPPKSDIDLLVVVSDLDQGECAGLYGLLAAYEAKRPYVAGLEVSAIRARDAANPVHPLPFLVHFGSSTKGPQPWVDGELPKDPDLVAHLMVSKQRGLSLFGPPPAEVVGSIAWDDYLAAVKADIDWLLSGDAVLESPRYAVLNLCRWAMMRAAAEQIIPSKEEAALWALKRLPAEHHVIVRHALSAYRSSAPVSEAELIAAGGPWDANALVAFRDWVKQATRATA